MSYNNKIIKLVFLSFLFLALNFSVGMLCRTFITFGTVNSDEIMGKPNIPLLISMSSLCNILLFVVYLIVKNKLRFKNKYANAYLFSISYLIIFFLPTLIGMNAYDFSGGWNLFTSPRLRNLSTLISDCLGLLAATPLLGLLSTKTTRTGFKISNRIVISMLINAIVFSTGMYFLTQLGGSVFGIANKLYPTGKSFNFNVLFYTPFALTGLGIPLTNKLLNSGTVSLGKRIVNFLSVIFVLLWMPLQIVIVAFGVSVSDGLVFILFSLVPFIACCIITDTIKEKAPQLEHALKSQNL